MHTLQLSIKAGLEVAHNLLTKCKVLISLLSREKKRKQLREVQIRVVLTNNLENSNNNDYCCNSANICDKLLSNEEFKVVQALVELLYPFDKATEILFGSNYATLSIIIPTIEELVYQLNYTNTNFNFVNE
ncbi:26823_t:CDS:2, partial [Gigaspora margarita]